MTHLADSLVLESYADREVELTPDDLAFIRDHLAGRFAVSELAGHIKINPQQYAGVVVLPSGLRLTIRPRIETASILYMLAVAYKLPAPFLDALADVDQLEDLLEILALHFADLADERIHAGLYRAYMETEENLSVVRGRIDFPKDIIHNSVLRQHVYCRFSELTWDVPENQIIGYVAQLLTGFGFRRPELQRRLAEVSLQLGELTWRPLSAGEARGGFNYTRLNEAYETIHKVCALLLDGLALTEQRGQHSFPAFLVDMNSLFERFVTQVLEDNVAGVWTIVSQWRGRLNLPAEASPITIIPDIVLRRHGHNRVIADCKYKRTQTARRENADFFQVLAYCVALNVTEGFLIYPEHEAPVTGTFTVRNTSPPVHIHTVSIGLKGSPSEMRERSRELYCRLTGVRPASTSQAA